MTKKTVRAGTTADANGSLLPGDVLNIQGGPAGGGAGGIAIVTTSLADAGTINVQGGAAALQAGTTSGAGGTLLVQGVLTDSGSIVLHAGRMATGAVLDGQGGEATISGSLSVTATGSVVVDGGFGATRSVPPGNGGTLTNAGVTTNAGLIMLSGGQGNPVVGPVTSADGGVLDNVGTLTNTGMLVVQAGRPSAAYYAYGGRGATLDDFGVLTNSGILSVNGGGSAEMAGTLSVEGVLTNTGKLLLTGGLASGSYYPGGPGAVLENAGTLTNAGLIEVRGGSTASNGNGGYGAIFDDTGTLSSTGTILVGGGGSSYERSSMGGTITVTGSLTSGGALTISGGIGTAYGGNAGQGGVLVDKGFVDNTGLLTIGGGTAGGRYGVGGLGGELIVASGFFSQLSNTGTIVVQGGEGTDLLGRYGRSDAGGGGGIIVDANNIFYELNTLTLNGGTGGSAGGGGGAFLTVDGFLGTEGTLTIGAGVGGAGATLTVSSTGTFSIGGTVENDSLLELQQGSLFYGEGTLRNTGVITGSGDLQPGVLVNDGIVDVGSGAIFMKEDHVLSDTGSGVFLIGAGGLLTFYDVGVDATQTVDMVAAGASLSLTADNVGNSAGVLIVSPFGGTVNIFEYPGYPSIATLNAADTNLTVRLDTATNLTLSRMSAITAIGSSGSDTITALSTGQTLTGGAGNDLLTGAAATGDVFQDVAAGLNGDTIAVFAGTDTIDVTDFAPGAGLILGYVQQGAAGKLTLSEGSANATITLQGQFTTASFTTGSDLHGGLLVGLHG